MAKRYHESRPTHHMPSHIDEGHYSSHDERRKLEARDAAMISEDHSAIANMPQNVIMREYPRTEHYLPEDLNDTISGIDHQKGVDGMQLHKHLDPKKV